MSEQVRAWKRLKSFELALAIGGFAGIIAIGLTYGKFVGDLEPAESVLAGVGIAAILTLILTYVFDSISQSVASFRNAFKGRKGGPGKK